MILEAIVEHTIKLLTKRFKLKFNSDGWNRMYIYRENRSDYIGINRSDVTFYDMHGTRISKIELSDPELFDKIVEHVRKRLLYEV